MIFKLHIYKIFIKLWRQDLRDQQVPPKSLLQALPAEVRTRGNRSLIQGQGTEHKDSLRWSEQSSVVDVLREGRRGNSRDNSEVPTGQEAMQWMETEGTWAGKHLRQGRWWWVMFQAWVMSEASLLRCPAGAGTKGWRQQGRIQAGNKRVYRTAGCLLERHKTHSPESTSKDCIVSDLINPTFNGQLVP